MKITGIRSVLYEYQLTRPVGDANIQRGVTSRADLALFVDTDEGIEGVTVAHPLAQRELRALGELIIGEDPRAVRGLWQRMIDATFKVGNQGSVAAAIAGIDCALWDLRAKANGLPLWRELGATTSRVKAYASGLDTPLTDQELRSFYAGMAAQGVTAGKVKVGLDPDDDLRRVGIAAEALGVADHRVSLMVDANEFWSPKQAIRRMAELERDFDILWVEEPARRWDVEGLRQVSRATRAAVASGENLRDIHEFLPLLRHDAVDIIQIGHNTTGITGALRVADLAQSFERPVTLMNCPGRFSAHLAAVLPHHMMMEVLDIGRDATFQHGAPIQDGWLVLDDQPGCGITFDQGLLEDHTVDTANITSSRDFLARGWGAGVREGTWVRHPQDPATP